MPSSGGPSRLPRLHRSRTRRSNRRLRRPHRRKHADVGETGVRSRDGIACLAPSGSLTAPIPDFRSPGRRPQAGAQSGRKLSGASVILHAITSTDTMANLFIRKPLSMLTAEAGESGEHSLKRTLGVFQLTALGVGAIIGAGIFVMVGLGAQYAGPGLTLSFVLSGLGCAFAALCYAEFAAMIPLAGSAYTYAYATLGEIIAWIIGWDLTLEYAMGASTVSSGWSNHFIELLDIFHVKMPLWLAYDHWTGLHTAEDMVARQMALAADPTLVTGTQAFLQAKSGVMAAQSPELLQRAHALLNAPHLFGYEIGVNIPPS